MLRTINFHINNVHAVLVEADPALSAQSVRLCKFMHLQNLITRHFTIANITARLSRFAHAQSTQVSGI